MIRLKRLIQFLLFLTILNGLLFYIGWNGWKWLNISFGFDNGLIYFLLYILVSYSFLIGRLSPYLSVFRTIGYVWFGIFQYALLLVPIANIVVLVLHLTTGAVSQTTYMLVGLTVVILLVLIFAYGLFNAYSPVIRKYEIAVPKKNGNHSSLRIAVASDMHFGRLSGVSHLKNLVKKVKEIRPDLILLPGDILDDELGPFVQKNMGPIMGDLQAPLGVFGVLGNHEYYGGQIPEFIKQMKEINIKILMDEMLTIDDSFHLIGRKDKTDKNRKPFEELMMEIDRSLPIFVMDHQPYEIKQAQFNGVDVIFSGHTHRGQMSPNHLITRKMYDLDWGYVAKEQLHVFVSSGYGFWGPPMRIGSRSEILQIDVMFE